MTVRQTSSLALFAVGAAVLAGCSASASRLAHHGRPEPAEAASAGRRFGPAGAAALLQSLRPLARFRRHGPTADSSPPPLDCHSSLSAYQQRLARFLEHPDRLFYPPSPPRPWQFVVLHHSATESGSLASIDRYHRENRGWDECGYHLVVGNGTESGDGQIEVGGRWLKQKHGAHCRHPDHPEYNQFGIGICLVGNFNQGPPTIKQLEATRLLVAYLTLRYGISTQHVATHGQLVAGHTECPGQLFPFDRIIAAMAPRDHRR